MAKKSKSKSARKKTSGHSKSKSSPASANKTKSTASRGNSKASERTGGEKDRGLSKFVADTSVPAETTAPDSVLPFPVVGIGASAGGLDALEDFFQVMLPAGAAFVVTTHLSPDAKSLLPDLLRRAAKMPVVEIVDNMILSPDTIFVLPPGHEVFVSSGKLKLPSQSEALLKRGQLIDRFLTSLAVDQKVNAIGIVMSGSGADGSQGCKAIEEQGGLVMVQKPSTAKNQWMPQSAISTVQSCIVLPANELPHALIASLADAKKHLVKPRDSTVALSEQAELREIFDVLRRQTRHDFSKYKVNTIRRRIERRMGVHHLKTLAKYARYLQTNSLEVRLLFRELLIGVTSFFRDAKAYEYLESQAIPELLAKKQDGDTVRVWVTGCASGQEAYSLAILLHEAISKLEVVLSVQVFATDIDEHAVQVARNGTYSKAAIKGVSPERLSRYFTKTSQKTFEINGVIREIVLFALQDLTRDPPFTKLDILSCRNLLIYFQAELQSQLFPIFHYSLNPHGILVLGSSETVGHQSSLFKVKSKKWKVFSKEVSEPTTGSFLMPATVQSNSVKQGGEKDIILTEDSKILHYIEAILAQSSTPPCVVIDQDLNIVYVHGKTGRFLEPAEGKVSVNLLDMARVGLRAELAKAIRETMKTKSPVSKQNLEVIQQGGNVFFDLNVVPLVGQKIDRELMMVTFEEATSGTKPKSKKSKQSLRESGRSREEVELELRDTRESLQAAIEELQASNEELKSTNEEMQSTNEELQSTNEELETSKEELQSLNEESTTVNGELETRIEDLSKTSDDMKNLLDSIDIAAVFLDEELNIGNFTPRFVDLVKLEAQDKGRSIGNFTTTIVEPLKLKEFAAEVLADLAIREVEVTSEGGDSYLMRGRPYRTTTNMIAGVVLTFENITDLRKAENELTKSMLQQNEERILSVIDACQDGMVLTDLSGRIHAVNRAFCEFIGYTSDELLNMTIHEFTAQESQEISAKYLTLGQSMDPADQPATFQKRFERKGGGIIEGRVTVSWHEESSPSKTVYGIAFVRELKNL